jgi:hypothetical protein
MFSFIYRHDDETNARLDEGIRAKIKEKRLVAIQLWSHFVSRLRIGGT